MRFNLSILRKNSIKAGLISSVLLTVLTASMIVSLNRPADAAIAAYIACDGADRPTLRSGDRGSCVTRAQQALASRNLLTAAPNGVFGPATHAATVTFQTRQGLAADGIIGPLTWRALEGVSTVNEESQEQSSLPASCQTGGKVICVVKGSDSHATLHAVERGAIVRSFDARTGDARGPADASDDGVFRVYWKHVDHVSSIFDAAMPFSLFYNGGEAVHFSQNFADIGYAGASHGCVNLRDWAGAEWLYDWTPINTRVVVTR